MINFYLIQRGSFYNLDGDSLTTYQNGDEFVEGAVRLDYMGSSEFEFGAVPK